MSDTEREITSETFLFIRPGYILFTNRICATFTDKSCKTCNQNSIANHLYYTIEYTEVGHIHSIYRKNVLKGTNEKQ